MRAALALLVALSFPVAGGAQEDVERELRAAEAALARIRADESSVAEELEQVEARIREAQAAYEEARDAADEAAALRAPLLEAEEEARAELAETLEALRPRLASRYRLLRRGRGLAGEDPASVLRLSRSMDRILEADLELIRAARKVQRRHASARARLDEAEAAALAEAEAARALLQEAEDVRVAREALLRGIRTERAVQERAHRELAAAQRELKRRVALLERREARGGFARGFGSLPWPVVGGVVEVPFGQVVNAKFRTVTSHNGLDLRVAEGTEVATVGRGTVAYAGWFRGYGNLVIVDHGDAYHSLYGHLASFDVEVGDEVERGQRIGFVGDTGSLKGPFLYFELREDGEPTDPLPWLQGR